MRELTRRQVRPASGWKTSSDPQTGQNPGDASELPTVLSRPTSCVPNVWATYAPGRHPFFADDAPGIDLTIVPTTAPSASVTLTDQVQEWLMWKPYGASSIWVPLEQTGVFGFQGTAGNRGTWSLQSFTPAPVTVPMTMPSAAPTWPAVFNPGAGGGCYTPLPTNPPTTPSPRPTPSPGPTVTKFAPAAFRTIP